MKIALAQIGTTVGDFEGNAATIRETTARARDAGAELVVFPELCLSGYSPRDLLDSREFVDDAKAALEALARPADWNRDVGLVVGFPERRDLEAGIGVYNAAALIEGGRLRALARKTLLPFYDVFDEGRYFDPAAAVTVVSFRGLQLGITICEDVWNDALFWTDRRRYPRDPVAELVQQGADVIVNLSASPFAARKPRVRSQMIAATAARHGVQVVMVNQVGGNDALVFDGNSQAFAADGQPVIRCAAFQEDLRLFDTNNAIPEPDAEVPEATPEGDADDVRAALVTGIRDYCVKTGFRQVVLGLSGGMDSSLVAALAAEALGPGNVLGILMPSRYTSDASTEDALALAANLGIEAREIPIAGPFEAFLQALEPHFQGRPPDLTEENLQARIRGVYLMALSNKLGHLLLATGNKSEVAVGYATLYGDMAGGLAPIADVLKTVAYAVAHRVNAHAGREVIPRRVFEKAPTAELRPDQTDQDSLPPYEILDPIIAAYVEERLSLDDIVARGHDAAIVERVLQMILRAEYKRRQAAMVLKVTSRAFGEGWRMPVAHTWRPEADLRPA